VKLSGKVAIVTGTSPNIGGGIAGGLADEGARVACVDVVEDNARQCAEWIRTRGGDGLGIVADTTDEAQVEAMGSRARATTRARPSSSPRTTRR
jgi:NAD(P)-dependent dehydrogenase (short-subunit alcohol dehydrogenase family)